jgi:hypothetical protein
MEGEALIWFQDAEELGQFPTWEAFLQALLIRFDPTYDDPMESLMRLCQVSMVAEYTSPNLRLSQTDSEVFLKITDSAIFLAG